MGRRRQAMPGLRRPWVSQENVEDAGHFVNALFKSSIMGVAICDRRLRFCAVNGALALMNGLPAALHIGKTIHAVLGSAAAKIQPAFEHVFATGEPLSNFELTAELPTRGVVGHWHESYFPIRDEIGRVQQVGAIVLEITKRNELDVAIMRLITKLAGMRSTLRRDSGALEIPEEAGGKSTEVFARSAAELESCLLEARSISQLLHDASSAMPAHRACMPLRKRPEEEGQAFALAQPIENEMEYPNLLSSREREVVALLAKGQSNKEIGNTLVISTRTVETHRARIMLKLDMRSLGELIRYAVRTRLVQL